jgi:hypothetical protein
MRFLDAQAGAQRGAGDSKIRSGNERRTPGGLMAALQRDERVGKNLDEIGLLCASQRTNAAVGPDVGVGDELAVEKKRLAGRVAREKGVV